MRFRDNSKWRTFAWCSACFSSSWSRLQTIVDEASSSVFRKQNAPQVAPQRSRWTRFASRKLLSAYSHILTWFWAVLLTTRVTWACRLLVACIGALLVKLHPPAPLGPGWKLKIQRLILGGTAWTDVHTKFGGLIRWGRTLEIFLKVGRFFAMFSPTVGSSRGGRS